MGSLRMERKRGKGYITGLMATNMMENGEMI